MMTSKDYEEIYSSAPAFCQSVLSLFRDYDPCVKNSVILSLLSGIGAGADEVYFFHEGMETNLHSYIGIFGSSGSGKSCATTVKKLFGKEHQALRNLSNALRNEYMKKLSESKKEDRDLIQIPPLFTFFLPGDTTTSALVTTVKDNNGRGVIWESELDTLTRMMKSEFGNFSDALRNNYDGGSITYNRRTGKEIIEVDNPHFSAVFSGTPGQYVKFFGSSENGLFSRFAFCEINTEDVWKDRWDSPIGMTIINDYAYQISELFQKLKGKKIQIAFDKNCRRIHFEYFQSAYRDFQDIGGEAMRGVIKRMGLNAIKWAGCLEVIDNMFNSNIESTIWKCDFSYMKIALKLAESSLQDALNILKRLPKEEPIRTTEWENYYKNLPNEFTYNDLPQEKGKSTLYRHINDWISKGKIVKNNDKYIKIK